MNTVKTGLLEEMTRRLVEAFDPDRIILFGSHAWGRPDDDSDVDLLVIVPESELPPSRRAQKAHGCLSGLGVPKDVLVKTRAEVDRLRHVHTSLVCRILEEGKLLYERRAAR